MQPAPAKKDGSLIANRSKSDSPRRKRSALIGEINSVKQVYAAGRLEQVAQLTELYPETIAAANLEEHLPRLKDVEVIFSTWGMPELTPRQLDCMPNLKAVFFAAGSVHSFAKPLLEREITVVSAWQANAMAVAEFTLGQILLATKGYFRNTREYVNPSALRTAHRGRGNFGETIALLGCGAIGSQVAELLRNFQLNVIAFDPFLSAEKAVFLNVKRVSLEEAFAQGYVVSNHLADLPETRGILSRGQFARMQKNATFINTGRGATVDEPAIIEVLKMRPDLTALLDVTSPEPTTTDSPFFALPNVWLTTHIAGSLGNEVVRMADSCIREFLVWESGKPPRYAVSISQLQTMA